MLVCILPESCAGVDRNLLNATMAHNIIARAHALHSCVRQTEAGGNTEMLPMLYVTLFLSLSRSSPPRSISVVTLAPRVSLLARSPADVLGGRLALAQRAIRGRMIHGIEARVMIARMTTEAGAARLAPPISSPTRTDLEEGVPLGWDGSADRKHVADRDKEDAPCPLFILRLSPAVPCVHLPAFTFTPSSFSLPCSSSSLPSSFSCCLTPIARLPSAHYPPSSTLLVLILPLPSSLITLCPLSRRFSLFIFVFPVHHSHNTQPIADCMSMYTHVVRFPRRALLRIPALGRCVPERVASRAAPSCAEYGHGIPPTRYAAPPKKGLRRLPLILDRLRRRRPRPPQSRTRNPLRRVEPHLEERRLPEEKAHHAVERLCNALRAKSREVLRMMAG
ncbi:hypothetical protein DFH09DRAFT_1331686 [Mycena vulgaris]|nr:hypothetical protein DFH09DRAFT_1331686 [Mycena vulgaris]